MKLSNQSEAAFINVSLLFLLLKKGYEDLSTTFFKTLKWFGSLIFRKPHNDFSGFVPSPLTNFFRNHLSHINDQV